MPEEVLRNHFGVVGVVPPLAPELSFRLALLDAESFSMAAAFRATGEISLQALATLVPYEGDLVDWLELYAEAHEFKLLGIASGDTEYGQAVHAMARAAEGAELRLLATGNGAGVILSVGRMPEGAPESIRDALGVAAATFEFTTPCEQRTREPVVVFTDRENMFRLACPEPCSCDTLDALRPTPASRAMKRANGRSSS